MVPGSEGSYLGEGEAVTALNRDQLLHEAGALKMRAMRLRALGDTDEQWASVVLFHEAARKELEALSVMRAPSAEAQAGTLVEACGLFLEARDPVRAAQQWGQLPPSIFTSGSHTALLAKVLPLYKKQVADFARAWRSLRGSPGAPDITSLRETQLRSLADKYPGVAELWWAVFQRTRAEPARMRMLELDSSLARAEDAKAAWERIEEVLVRNLRITMKAEKQGRALPLDLVNRISDAFSEVLSGFAEGTFGSPVNLLPIGSKVGSFIVEISAQGLPPSVLPELIRELRGTRKRIDARRLSELLTILQQNDVELTISEISSGEQTSDTEESTLFIDKERRNQWIEAAESAALRTVDSRDVPQADSLKRVFHMVKMASKHKPFDAEALGITPRQVLYYRRAAQILGFFKESGEVTAAGRLISRLDPKARIKAAVVHFESSRCGDAWIRWSKGKTLLDVQPDSAYEFLRKCAPGLSKNTRERRVKTLIAWHQTLCNYHYSREP